MRKDRYSELNIAEAKRCWDSSLPQAQNVMRYIYENADKQSFSFDELCSAAELDMRVGQDGEGLEEIEKGEAVKELLLELGSHPIYLAIGEGNEVSAHWIAKTWIRKDPGRVEIRLDGDMDPYLKLLIQETFRI